MSLSHRVTEIIENWFENGVDVKQKGATATSLNTLVPVDTTVNGTTLASSNPERINITIQNNGTEPLLIKLGGDPSITDYSLILASSSGVRLGDGGVYTSDYWKGDIKGIVETADTIVSVIEEVVA